MQAVTEPSAPQTDICELVVRIARKVFYSDAPITLQSKIADDLLATPVDILDLCRHLQGRLDIVLGRDELLFAIKTEPRTRTLLWLAKMCEERRARQNNPRREIPDMGVSRRIAHDGAWKEARTLVGCF